jgi:hypothetical protein
LTRSKKVLGLLLLAATMVLTACGWTGTGVVVGKTKTDAYSYVSFQCAGFDAKGNCTVQMPITNYVPDYYYLQVNSDQDGKVHDVSVNYEYWMAAKSGDKFDNRKKES